MSVELEPIFNLNSALDVTVRNEVFQFPQVLNPSPDPCGKTSTSKEKARIEWKEKQNMESMMKILASLS